MAVKRLNLLGVELDERLDEAGFRHAATSVGHRLAAKRIGAGVYEAEAGLPIWPYHYHYGIEEWLYVIAGAPVLREPAGERTLTPGDLVCFPSGHAGAHTVKGPGRFVIFDGSHGTEPYTSVYPDSDKVSGPAGMLLRSSAVGYWHGEGTAGPSEPGLLVLAGTPTSRHPHAEDELAAGDLVCFPEGPAGAHELLNRTGSVTRTLLLSTTGLPANVCYPDTGRWLLRNEPGSEDVALLSDP